MLPAIIARFGISPLKFISLFAPYKTQMLDLPSPFTTKGDLALRDIATAAVGC